MPEKSDKKEFVSGYDTMPDVEDLEKIVDKELEKLEETPAVPNRQKLMLAKKKRLLRQRRQVIPRSLRWTQKKDMTLVKSVHTLIKHGNFASYVNVLCPSK